MDINEPIRFRVIDEEFVDLTPTGPTSPGSLESNDPIEQKKAPYSILVSPLITVFNYVCVQLCYGILCNLSE